VATVDPLAQHPNIASLQKVSANGPGAIKRFCEYRAPWLPRLDAALSHLDMASRPSLRGLADDLFSSDDNKLFAAISELLAFDWLKREGLLEERDIGFPSDWSGGDDPPFEGVLNVSGRSIAFDVKDGSGDGEAPQAADDSVAMFDVLNHITLYDDDEIAVMPARNMTKSGSDRSCSYSIGVRRLYESICSATEAWLAQARMDPILAERVEQIGQSGAIMQILPCAPMRP
jgi:hypothetical protein